MSKALVWSDDLKVGNEIIDTEHRETVELLGVLAAADDASFPAEFAKFADHLRVHLAHEEALMAEFGFPAEPIHRREHDRVRLELEGVEKRLAAGNTMLARGYATQAVPDWFVTHKNTMDAATAAWIRQQGG